MKTSGCCPGGGVKNIDVGGVKVGIVGLDEVFKKCFDAGLKPEDLDGFELLAALGEMNYIAEGSEEAYKEALLREYRKYCESKKK